MDGAGQGSQVDEYLVFFFPSSHVMSVSLGMLFNSVPPLYCANKNRASFHMLAGTSSALKGGYIMIIEIC